MQPLFSKDGLDILKAFSLPDTLYAFDFDGTLAPLVGDPKQVMILEHVRLKLTELANIAKVAVISGRRREDLQTHITSNPTLLLGNHGAEDETGSQNEMLAKICNGWKLYLEPRLKEIQGVWLEDKVYSLSIHYRNADNPITAAANITQLIATLEPSARVLPGIYVFNIMDPTAPDKGTSLLRLMEKQPLHKAIFIGDDENDEDIFRLRRSDILSIKVGRHDISEAAFYINQQSEIDTVLAHILAFLRNG